MKLIHIEGALEGYPSKKLWLNHIKKHFWLYFFGIISVTGTTLADTVAPKIIQWTLDDLSLGGKELTKFLYLLISLLMVQFICRIFWRQTLGQQTHFVSCKMKSLIWNRARFFPKERLESDLSPGELMNVATADVGLARFLFGFTLVTTIDFIFLLTVTIIFMLKIDWQMTLIALAIIPILPILLDKLSRKENLLHHEAQETLTENTELSSQAVATVRLQRLSQAQNFWFQRLCESAERYRSKRLAVVQTGLAFIPTTGLAPLLSFFILLLIGIPKVMNGSLSIGSFVAMQSYIFLIQVPLLELGTLVSEWQRCFGSLDRFTNTLAQKEAPLLRSGGVTTTNSSPFIIQAKNVSFRYPKGEQTALKDFSLELKAGERFGVFGSVGSGKSTLLNILAGFERNFSGNLDLFGEDIRNISHTNLRQKIALVPQKPFLFADTLRSNLLLDTKIDDEQIWKILNIAGLREDIEGFPEKLETRLGEWGVNLSGGQKQRLTLARALVKKPTLLLLDDCLSAVDTLTEEHILTELDEHLKETTLIWVAHRSSTLKHCDRVVELR